MSHDHFKKQTISLDTLVKAGLLEKAEDGKYRPGQQGRSRQPESALSRQIAELQNQIKVGDVQTPVEKKPHGIHAAPVKVTPAKSETVDLNAVTRRLSGRSNGSR